MLVCVVDIDAVTPQALLEHNPPPPDHWRIRFTTPILGKEAVRDVVQIQPTPRFEMPQATAHEARPVADAVDEHAAVDEVERLRGERRPVVVALGIGDGKAAVRGRRRLLLRGGDVETEDVGVWMLSCEGEAPDACAAPDVDDALIGGLF